MIQLANAEKLIGGLGGEERRWKDTVVELTLAMDKLPGGYKPTTVKQTIEFDNCSGEVNVKPVFHSDATILTETSDYPLTTRRLGASSYMTCLDRPEQRYPSSSPVCLESKLKYSSLMLL